MNAPILAGLHAAAQVALAQPQPCLSPREQEAEEVWRLFLAERAELTARNYKVDLRDFARFMSVETPAQALALLFGLERGDAHKTVLAYKTHLLRKPVYRSEKARLAGEDPVHIGYAARTINRRLAALRAVTKLARLVEAVPWTLEIPAVRVDEDRRPNVALSREGYGALLRLLKDDIASDTNETTIWVRTRDLALVRLMHDACLRRMEPLSADHPADLDLAGARIRVHQKWRREKGWVPISDQACDDLRAWLALRGTHPGPLFCSSHPSHRGKRLGVRAVNDMMGRLCRRAGVHVTPHGLRKTGGTRALELTNGNVELVQRLLRHQDPSEVITYNQNRHDQVQVRALTNRLSETGDQPGWGTPEGGSS